MAYEAEVSRKNPTCILFLLDQSGSMSEPWGNINKAVALSDIINKFLWDLVVRNTKGEGVIDRLYVGVIGYGEKVEPVFKGVLSTKTIVPISEIANNPLRIEQRTKKFYDGGSVDVVTHIPIWVDPVAVNGTPMCKAINHAHDLVEEWLNEHPNCFPPSIINICGSTPTDGDIEGPADKLKSLSSSEGNVLYYNIYLSPNEFSDRKVIFPDSDKDLPDELSKKLFEVSSFLPKDNIHPLKLYGFPEIDLSKKSRGFMMNEGDFNYIFPIHLC